MIAEPSELDSLAEALGLGLDPERRRHVVAAYRDIAAEIAKLRTLDLTDVHPAIVFDPRAGATSLDEGS